MTEIPHPSNMTDQEQQRTHYFRQIAEQLARIGDALEKRSAPTDIALSANMTDRAQLQTFNLRQVAIQLARTADALETSASAEVPAKKPAGARKAKRSSAS
ncbi:MAG: hypothetical protein ACR2MY_02720 [Candidatus Dormibacteria bacterium]